MTRIATTLLLLLGTFPALAQKAVDAAEAPVEKASPIVIVVFLVLFVGTILGYVGYAMWTARQKKDKKD